MTLPCQQQCNAAAQHLMRQAAWPSAVVTAALLGLPWLAPMPLLATLALLAAVAVLALSALLVFDALLFRLMASHDDERAGGAAVDDFLSRTGLKPMPQTTRQLAARMAGANRLLLFQRIALALFLAAVLAAVVQIGSKAA